MMKEYSKEEVVKLALELTQEIADKKIVFIDNDITKNFLEEKGLLKPELEKGKWRKGIVFGNEYFMMYNDDKRTCGFYNGKYGSDWSFSYYIAEDCEEATDEEVKEMLIAEAEKRGVWNVPMKCLFDKFNWNNDNGFVVGYYDNKLWSEYGLVFNNGVFAEKLELPKKMTVKEIEDKLGFSIEIVK